MSDHEQEMCLVQADLFEFSFGRFECGSSFFISKFMYSDLAKELDNLDDEYNYISPNNMITILKDLYPSLNLNKGNKYPARVLRWIGYVYRAWNILKKRSSMNIYKNIKAEDMLAYYETFHTFSIEYCVDRLEEIVKEKEPQISDYEAYKKFMFKEQN